MIEEVECSSIIRQTWDKNVNVCHQLDYITWGFIWLTTEIVCHKKAISLPCSRTKIKFICWAYRLHFRHNSSQMALAIYMYHPWKMIHPLVLSGCFHYTANVWTMIMPEYVCIWVRISIYEHVYMYTHWPYDIPIIIVRATWLPS